MLEATGEPSVVLASLYLRAIKVAKAVDLDAETWPFRELSSRGDRTEWGVTSSRKAEQKKCVHENHC